MAKDKLQDSKKLDQMIAATRKEREVRERGYRQQALKLFPWVCGRCGRAFDRKNLSELTVHHIDHDHDNNPRDGSNWELLCVYCHDNEHGRQRNGDEASYWSSGTDSATSRPFSDLKKMLNGKKDS